MQIRRLLTLIGLSVALSTSANAQFSGPGSAVPTAGTGGDATLSGDGSALYDTVLPGFAGTSVAAVPAAVTAVDSVKIEGFAHTWAGDLQATLSDPLANEHLIFLRPGYLNASTFGTAGDFTGGDYTFVQSGGSSLPTSSNGLDITPGTYNQSFSSGGTTWVSGTHGISNTPMSSIAGPAGNWTLKVYDWGGGDVGSFGGWTLNVQTGGGPNTGNAYCFGDGTHVVACPCAGFGNPGEGCMTTSGTGATLTGSGNASVFADTFVLTVTGGPANKPGIFFQGSNQGGLFNGDGILCVIPQIRYDINSLDATGSTSQTNFGVNATSGQVMNYQYWFRDPANPCGGLWNFSGGWTVPAWN